MQSEDALYSVDERSVRRRAAHLDPVVRHMVVMLVLPEPRGSAAFLRSMRTSLVFIAGRGHILVFTTRRCHSLTSKH